MSDSGNWWYDRLTAVGATDNPSSNADMISPAFWLARGRECKITRSDDPSHTPLLQTTGNCLGMRTFRSKITSYGNFRNGKVWSSDRCLGSFNMADSTRQQTGFNRLSVVATSKVATRSASGVTGMMVMDR